MLEKLMELMGSDDSEHQNQAVELFYSLYDEAEIFFSELNDMFAHQGTFSIHTIFKQLGYSERAIFLVAHVAYLKPELTQDLLELQLSGTLKRTNIHGRMHPLKKTVPPNIGYLQSLIKLNIAHNHLTHLPARGEAHLFKLNQLEFLNLQANRLSKLPESLSKLKKLTYLNLADNRLRRLPKNLGKLVHLKNLYLTNNRLVELPESIVNLVHITRLNLRRNRIEDLPQNISQNEHLIELDLSFNRIARHVNQADNQLVQRIASIPNLQVLNLSQNFLKRLPQGMTQWKQIQTLILDHNYFSTFPKKISGLLSLTTLSLEDNNLHRLQTSTIMRLLDRIASIPNLHTLNLSRNSLFFLSELECTQFIDILAKMKNLKTLNLRKTDLHEFKDQILEKLNHIEDLKIDSRKENHVYFTGQNR